MVTSDVWVALRQSCFAAVCEASHSAGFDQSECGDWEELCDSGCCGWMTSSVIRS
jgi:hypothetical protein